MFITHLRNCTLTTFTNKKMDIFHKQCIRSDIAQCYFWTILDRVTMFFQLDYPNEYMVLAQWCSPYKPPLLPVLVMRSLMYINTLEDMTRILYTQV